MDRNRATYEAFDGVEVRLLDGVVVRCPALTVAEAVRYLRLMGHADYNVESAHGFLRDFPARIGIKDVPLSALGLNVEGAGDGNHAGDVTVAGGLALLELLGAAQDSDGWTAQSDFLVRFPEAMGIQNTDAWEVFRHGHAFAEAYYLAVFGFARDFLQHLRSSPRARVLVMTGAALSSTSASTT